jgi:hypothetical protein
VLLILLVRAVILLNGVFQTQQQMLYGSLAGGYGYGLGFESDGGQATWQLGVDGLLAPLRNGISLQVINVSGHTDSDDWLLTQWKSMPMLV